MPRDEVIALLKQLLAGKGQQAVWTLRNRFSAWQRDMQGDRPKVRRRAVGDLRKNAEAAEKGRHEQEKRDRKKREIKRRKEREAYLRKQSKDFTKVWKAVQHTVERGSGLAYDEACCALVDLSEAYSLHASRKQFQQELSKFMAGHTRRKALIQRLVKAGIWVESL